MWGTASASFHYALVRPVPLLPLVSGLHMGLFSVPRRCWVIFHLRASANAGPSAWKASPSPFTWVTPTLPLGFVSMIACQRNLPRSTLKCVLLSHALRDPVVFLTAFFTWCSDKFIYIFICIVAILHWHLRRMRTVNSVLFTAVFSTPHIVPGT